MASPVFCSPGIRFACCWSCPRQVLYQTRGPQMGNLLSCDRHHLYPSVPDHDRRISAGGRFGQLRWIDTAYLFDDCLSLADPDFCLPAEDAIEFPNHGKKLKGSHVTNVQTSFSKHRAQQNPFTALHGSRDGRGDARRPAVLDETPERAYPDPPRLL